MTELELIEGCRRGENPSRHRLYDLYATKMMAVCYRYTGSKTISEDLLHDGFLKVFESIHKFQYRGDGSLRAWMTRVFVNLSIDFVQKNEVLNHSVLLENNHFEETIEEETVNVIPDEVLMQLITELPGGYRMVFNLFTFEDKSHKEIGQLLNINESSSRSQLARAKAILTRKIKTYIRNNE